MGISGHNLALISRINEKEQFEDIMHEFDDTELHKVDSLINLHTVYGKPFSYVLSKLESMNQAMDFFSKFGYEMRSYKDIADIFDRTGERIESLKGVAGTPA